MAGDPRAKRAIERRIGAVLAAWRQRLAEPADAEVLLGKVLKRSRAWLYAYSDERLDRDQSEAFEQLARRRLAGEPVAYLTGWREFYGRRFQVSPAVLIPRPETECLIDAALRLDLPPRARVLDVGTGSGCIALTLALERPDWQITASDICQQALGVADRNRARFGLDAVTLVHGDLLAPFGGRTFDLIVANPPYVAAADRHLETGDLRHEPRLALTDGGDGLNLLDRLIRSAADHLAGRAHLVVEHGFDQAVWVREMMHRRGLIEVTSSKDLATIERISMGRWPDRAVPGPQRAKPSPA